MTHHNARQAHMLALHIYHVSFKEGNLHNDMHLIYFTWCEIFPKIQCPTLEGYMHHHLLCLMQFDLYKPYLNGLACSTRRQIPTPLWALGSWKSPLLLCQPMRHISHSFVPQGRKTWPWLKVISLGHKAIVEHSVHGNNMFWLGLQSQLLTFRPWQKYDLAWYHQFNF